MTTTTVLQAALRAEYAIVYGYGVAGAHLRGRDEDYAAQRLAAHQLLRDSLLALDATDPLRPAGEPAYALPFPVTDPRTARALAIRLEDSAAGAMWDLVAASRQATQTRRAAVAALGDVGIAAARWRERTESVDDPALPGAPPDAQPASQPSTTPTTPASSSTTASGSTS